MWETSRKKLSGSVNVFSSDNSSRKKQSRAVNVFLCGDSSRKKLSRAATSSLPGTTNRKKAYCAIKSILRYQPLLQEDYNHTEILLRHDSILNCPIFSNEDFKQTEAILRCQVYIPPPNRLAREVQADKSIIAPETIYFTAKFSYLKVSIRQKLYSTCCLIKSEKALPSLSSMPSRQASFKSCFVLLYDTPTTPHKHHQESNKIPINHTFVMSDFQLDDSLSLHFREGRNDLHSLV